MMLANSTLRVVPLTIHIPLSDVEKTITPDLFKRSIEVLEPLYASTLTVLSRV